MKIKTSELIDASLDWAVWTAAGGAAAYPKTASGPAFLKLWKGNTAKYVHPSTDWAQGGPIIDREIGNFWKHNKLDPNEPDVWTAAAYRKAPDGTMLYYEEGPTPLIAAMRALVWCKLGDEIDIPKELSIIPSLQNPQSN